MLAQLNSLLSTFPWITSPTLINFSNCQKKTLRKMPLPILPMSLDFWMLSVAEKSWIISNSLEIIPLYNLSLKRRWKQDFWNWKGWPGWWLNPVAELRWRPEGAMAPPWGRKQQLIRRPNCFYKAPKSLKLPENDLEQLYQKVQKLLGPLRKTA